MPDKKTQVKAAFLPFEAIQFPSQQPRRYFDPDKMAQLIESVKHHGILEPLLVRPVSDTKYELVAGERRYRAAVQAGLAEVPVTIKKLTDEEALQISLTENLQREDLNPVDETEGILSLLSVRLGLAVQPVVSLLYQLQNQSKKKAAKNVNPHSLRTVIQVFQELGLMSWESFVSNRLPLLKLPPDILEVLRQGKIAYTKAKALSLVKDEETRKRLLQEALDKNLSLKAIKEKIARLKIQPETADPDFQIKEIGRRLKKAKPWKRNPRQWHKVREYLDKIEALLNEVEGDSPSPEGTATLAETLR
ncbi:MAG: ParB/RepB/Spo0J family partition protein [Oscillatoria sp. SIO1A7]|nr:ParB/RepB/Spo0J family partition protein [Oscillatoria sp. SIO1A7]